MQINEIGLAAKQAQSVATSPEGQSHIGVLGNKHYGRVWLHTFGKIAIDRTFISIDKIAQFKIEIAQYAGSGRSAPVEVVCYTNRGGKHILTPSKIVNDVSDLSRLSKFIIELLATISRSKDGTILRTYSEDGTEWEIVEEVTV